jgi:hypothetical protein
MLTEDNQLSALDRLKGIEALEDDIGGRTTRTTLGSEQFDEDRNAGSGCVRRRRFRVGLRALRLNNQWEKY